VFDQLAAQERLRSPTIMLLDRNRPQRDGKEILRHVKSIPHGSDIRVVMVTSSTNPRERAETLPLGADAYFVKPYHLNKFMHLGEVVKALVYGHESEGHTPSEDPLSNTTREKFCRGA
jgi:DNA-binding response OmpR family regulator